MDPVSISASIIALGQFVSSLNKYRQDVSDFKNDRKKLETEAAALRELLILLDDRSKRIERGEASARQSASSIEVLWKGPLRQLNILLKSLEKEVNRKQNRTNQLLWPFRSRDIQNACVTIQQIQTTLLLTFQLDSTEAISNIDQKSRDIEQSVQQLQKSLEEVQDGLQQAQTVLRDINDSHISTNATVDRIETRFSEEDYKKSLDWLSTNPSAATHAKLYQDFEEGSRQWLVKHPAFQEWLLGYEAGLLCVGVPGAGKSFTCSMVIEKVRTRVQWDGRAAFAYFYFNYKQSDLSFNTVMCSIIRHVASMPGFPSPEAQKLYQKHKDTRPKDSELKETFEAICARFSLVFIIFDALDECTTSLRMNIMQYLVSLQGTLRISIFATSRYTVDDLLFSSDVKSLEVQASDDDIEKFIQSHVFEFAKCVRENDKLQRQVTTAIQEAADGIFRLAQIHLDSLKNERREAKIEQILRTLPKGSNALSKAYEGVLARIDAQLFSTRQLACRTLSIIVLAKCELPLLALQQALIMCENSDTFNLKDVEDEEYILEACAGLIKCEGSSPWKKIILSHQTINEFFSGTARSWLCYEDSDLFEICMMCLLNPEIRKEYLKTEDLLGSEHTRSPEIRKSWRFFRLTEREYPPEKSQISTTCAELQDNSGSDVERSEPFDGFRSYFYNTQSLMVYGARYAFLHFDSTPAELSLALQMARTPGITKIALIIADTGAGRYITRPLTFADYVCCCGNLQMVEFLISNNCGLTTLNAKCQTPLYYAKHVRDQSLPGTNEIQRLILSLWGVECSKPEEMSIEAILKPYFSLQNHDQDLTEVQDELRSDTTSMLIAWRDSQEDSLLSSGEKVCKALLDGHVCTVIMLFATRDIDINAHDQHGRTILMLILMCIDNDDVRPIVFPGEIRNLRKYCLALLQFVLKHPSLNINMKDNDGKSALHYALNSRVRNIVRFLLAREDIMVDASIPHSSFYEELHQALLRSKRVPQLSIFRA